ncbi:MAG: hypothetical protein AABZ06_01430 [Bdellovibrionota bacterium]
MNTGRIFIGNLVLAAITVSALSAAAYPGRTILTPPVSANARSPGEGGPSAVSFVIEILLTNLSDRIQTVNVSALQTEMDLYLTILNCDPERMEDSGYYDCREIKRCDTPYSDLELIQTLTKGGKMRTLTTSSSCNIECGVAKDKKGNRITTNCREGNKLLYKPESDRSNNYHEWDETFLTVTTDRSKYNLYGKPQPSPEKWYRGSTYNVLAKKVNFYDEPAPGSSGELLSYAFSSVSIPSGRSVKLSVAGACYFMP